MDRAQACRVWDRILETMTLGSSFREYGPCAEIRGKTVQDGHIDWGCVLALDWLRF